MRRVSPAIHPISVLVIVCFCSSFWRSQNLRSCLCLVLSLPFLFVIPAGNLLLPLRLSVLAVVRSCCPPERRRSRPYRERRSRRTCGSYRLATTARTFLSPNSSPPVYPAGFSLRRNCPHHENAYPAPSNFPPRQPSLRPRRAPRNAPRRNPHAGSISRAASLRSAGGTSNASASCTAA